MSKATILLLSFYIFSSAIAINFEELTKDVFDKINLLRTDPTQFASQIDSTKYPKFHAKVLSSSETAEPLKLSQGLSLASAHRGQTILKTKKWDFSKPTNVANFATNVSDPSFFTIAYNRMSKDGVHAISQSSERMSWVVSRLRSNQFKTIGLYCGCYCPTLKLCSIYLSASDDVKDVDGVKVNYLKESTTGYKCRKTPQIMPSASSVQSQTLTDASGLENGNRNSDKSQSKSSQVPLSCLAKNPQNYQQLAKDSFVAQNHLRQYPKQWAQYMKWSKQYYDSNGRFQTPDMGYKLITNEGTVPVQESYDILQKMEPLPALVWDDTLARAAQKHVIDTSSKPVILGHTSRNGQSFSTRVVSFFNSYSTLGENIAYGPKSGLSQIAGLFIDDGVASRGHRKSIISKAFTHVGVACGCFDNQYKVICVYNFGSGLESKTPNTKYHAVNNKIEPTCSWPKSSNPFKVPASVSACFANDNKPVEIKDQQNQEKSEQSQDNKKQEQESETPQNRPQAEKPQAKKIKSNINQNDQKDELKNVQQDMITPVEEKMDDDEGETSSIYYKISKQVQRVINELRTEKGKQQGYTSSNLMGLQQVNGWNLLSARFHSQLQNSLRINTQKFPRDLFRYAYGFAEPYAADILYSTQEDIKVSDVAKILSDNIKQSGELKAKIFNGHFTSFGTYCSCHQLTQLFCVLFFSSGQDVWTNSNSKDILPKYPDLQGAPALSCGLVQQQIPQKNATPFNPLDFVPHQAKTFDQLVDEVVLNLNHYRLKPKMWGGYLSDYYSEFVTDNTGYFPMPDGKVQKIDLSKANGDNIDHIVKQIQNLRPKNKIKFSNGLSNYAKQLLTKSKRELVKQCGKGWRNVSKCYVQSAKRVYEFAFLNISNGQNTVARLLTLSTRKYLGYRVLKWNAINSVGVASGCDKDGKNKLVIVFGRDILEKGNAPQFKSSTWNIGKKCNSRASEKAVTLRDINQFIMDQ